MFISELAGAHPGHIQCQGMLATIHGNDGDNRLEGTSGNDVIAGLRGNDSIDGFGGNDHICGGRHH